MSQKLKDKVAIITGAGRGIGRAYALRFAEEGARLLLPDISLERAESVANEIRAKGGEAVAMETDISDEGATKMMAEKVKTQYGRADILLNNAAIFYGIEYKPWDTLTVEEWDRIFEVNVKGTWLCCKAIAPIMQQQKKGKIINVSSSLIKCPPQAADHQAHYTCTKAAVYMLTQILARALGSSGINVNAIGPGLTVSEATLTMKGLPPDLFEITASRRCIPGRVEPEDLVGTAVFLASEDSDFITGQIIFVDGNV